MLASYIPVAVMMVVVGIFSVAVIVLSRLLGRKQETREKIMAYECGNDPVGDARMRFSVKFYIVAVLFILFDIEAVFLYPWAVIYRRLGIFGLVEMGIFLGILFLGFIYVWRKGALEWGWKST
jgi:NADH-quinone oxidoreductase subunit A